MPFAYQPGVNDIATTDLEGSLRLVDAAKAEGVEHFVYTSFSGNIDLDFPLRNAKRTVEAYLKMSGLAWTILRPSFFMEVWLQPGGRLRRRQRESHDLRRRCEPDQLDRAR